MAQPELIETIRAVGGMMVPWLLAIQAIVIGLMGLAYLWIRRL